MQGTLNIRRGSVLVMLIAACMGAPAVVAQEADRTVTATPLEDATRYDIPGPPRWAEWGREGGARAGRSRIHPPPIYSLWYDVYRMQFCQYPWQDCEYYGPDCGDQGNGFAAWCPQRYAPGSCGETGGCDCWSTFATWYYQDNLLCWYVSGPVEDAPLTFGNFEAALDSSAPPTPTYAARFAPIEGFDCLKNIPLECTNSVRPVAAAARYSISVEGHTSSSNDFAGALFFVTAVYDETIFDVKVAGTVLRHPGSYYQWVYRKDTLPSLGSIMFQDELYEWNPTNVMFRQSEWRTIPDYIEIGLKNGRILDDVKGPHGAAVSAHVALGRRQLRLSGSPRRRPRQLCKDRYARCGRVFRV